MLDGGDVGPDLIQELPKDLHAHLSTLIRAAKQTMACKGIFSVITSGRDLEECKENIRATDIETLNTLIDSSWCFRFEQMGRGKKPSTKRRTQIVEAFGARIAALHRQPVRLINARHQLVYLEDYRRKHGSPALSKDASAQKIWLLYQHTSETSNQQIRSWVDRLSLSKRAFISTTSLSAERSIQLANLALDGDGKQKSILDPFCGSGSILLAATALGARCVGADKRNYLLLRHRRVLQIPPSKHRPQRGTEKVCIFDNFTELGLAEPRIIPAINIFNETAISQYKNANQNEKFDAIITDPPYGIRASLSQSEADIYTRLIHVAEQLLVPSGKLVFLLPTDHRIDLATKSTKLPFALSESMRIASIGWERFSNNRSRMVVVIDKL